MEEQQSVPEKQGDNRQKVGPGNPPIHSRFKPGQSGNPAGRPKRKTISEIYAELLTHTDENGDDMATVIARKVLEEALTGNLDSIKEVTDRTEGKPKQRTEINGTLTMENMTPEQRRARIDELERKRRIGIPDTPGDGVSGDGTAEV